MKQLTLLALAALFISCSDDDTNNVSIDGTWKLTHVKVPGEDWNGDGITHENAMDETTCFDQANIIFGEEEAIFAINCTFFTESESEATTYVVTDDTVVVTYHVTMVPGVTKQTIYKRHGNKLTTTFGNYDDYNYIPGEGENADTFSLLWGATFTYTKQ